MTEPADSFRDCPTEGPFAFKSSRDQPISQHFDRFKELSPDQTACLLAVRDGSRPTCVIELPGELILAEYAGTGYVDETTHRSWGYTIRRRNLDKVPANENDHAITAPVPQDTAATVGNDARAAEIHEKELQELRLAVLASKARSEKLEADLAEMRQKLVRLEPSLAASETVIAKLRVESSAVQIEKARLDLELSQLRADLAASRAKNGSTSDPANGKAASLEAKKLEETKRLVSEQEKKIDRDRRLISEETSKLAQEREALQAMREKLDADRNQLESHVEAQEVWVAPDAYATRLFAVNNDEATQILARICVCWFVTLVLLIQCVRLAQQAGW
jgi:hypothetical protein